MVYLLQCAHGYCYTGVTTDVARRYREHRNGTGGRFTRANPPLKLLYTEACRSERDAKRREAEIKRWPRRKKAALWRSTVRTRN